ncbi:MAG: hypoxanthine-guanine phosphoribosyltransferase [Xanthomonadales bacterium]|nr:hypoxanthine-guanine phosphoribosyltransferase [Gammaproteobacteria bacterium]MBT8053253.1 hypoxanthine-guanine phosphoribosyltransferase [Gammaproteobacteria bacterium]NND56052.1 hypoxanthine-guanine phosphoribosyltransferase [Xanthomonadales bacterium]NNK50293.1 hypoxanthine-guanine phosphoribosyltransferase [Xanthomonadales bacterium]
MTEPDPRHILSKSTLLASREQVDEAIAAIAEAVNAHYEDQEIILLIVMTGAVMPAAWLASRLRMPVRMDFLHATRYSGQTEGGDIEFRVPPRLNMEGQDVLIVDDIYDIGLTLQMIEKYCLSRGARSVNSAVLVRKIHDRETTGNLPAFIGMEIEDRYLFGCGMDAYEHWRHLDEIRALEVDA